MENVKVNFFGVNRGGRPLNSTGLGTSITSDNYTTHNNMSRVGVNGTTSARAHCIFASVGTMING